MCSAGPATHVRKTFTLRPGLARKNSRGARGELAFTLILCFSEAKRWGVGFHLILAIARVHCARPLLGPMRKDYLVCCIEDKETVA